MIYMPRLTDTFDHVGAGAGSQPGLELEGIVALFGVSAGNDQQQQVDPGQL
jgi:hypothetical protein